MTAFVVFGFAVQVLLIAFFVGLLVRAGWQPLVGRFVYGAGLVAAGLAVVFAVTGEPWHMILATGLYAAWALLGATVDLLRPIEWRNPPRWAVIATYAGLLMAALLVFWIPLWWIDWRLWVAFGVLYAIHTTINLWTHAGRGRTRKLPTNPG